jgi:hypothetical protein
MQINVFEEAQKHNYEPWGMVEELAKRLNKACKRITDLETSLERLAEKDRLRAELATDPYCSKSKYLDTVKELDALKAENEKLRHQVEIERNEAEFERNWVKTFKALEPENQRLRARIVTLRASLMYIQLHCDHNNSEESCVCKVDLERAAYEALAQDDEAAK